MKAPHRQALQSHSGTFGDGRAHPQLLPLLIALLLPGPSAALEHYSFPATPSLLEPHFQSASTCTIRYYNMCNGWASSVVGWQPYDRFGTVFENCPEGGGTVATLTTTWFFMYGAMPPGWGYSGTIGIYPVGSDDCPQTTALAEQPFAPHSRWNSWQWSVPVPGRFAVMMRWGGEDQNPAYVIGDLPQGPTGAAACGACYPTRTVPRSYYWGSPSDRLCPGQSFDGGGCPIEWILDVGFARSTDIPPTTWGKLKVLYR